MSENTWPEQEAVDEWVAQMRIEVGFFTHEELYKLKEAVTAPRLALQARLARMEDALEVIANQRTCREAADTDIYEDVDTYDKLVLTARAALADEEDER